MLFYPSVCVCFLQGEVTPSAAQTNIPEDERYKPHKDQAAGMLQFSLDVAIFCPSFKCCACVHECVCVCVCVICMLESSSSNVDRPGFWGALTGMLKMRQYKRMESLEDGMYLDDIDSETMDPVELSKFFPSK